MEERPPETEEERAGRTESLFREVNERLAASALRAASATGELVCECADPACAHRLSVPLDEYERVRGHGARFVLAEGHEDARVEQRVQRRRGFQVVEKRRAAARVARRLDPRAA